MTRINDYLWHLPHDPQPDDPPEVAALIATFNGPVAAGVSEALAAQGYNLSMSDVVVKLEERLDDTYDTFLANVRFVKYVQPDVMARVHFEHAEWATFVPEPDMHRFFITLDRFKTMGETRQVVPAWDGRLHSRLSNLPGDTLHFEDMDQLWTYQSPGELDEHLGLFLDKFDRLVVPWLENLNGIT